MSILSGVDKTMNETDLFIINKQLSECLQKVSEITQELNDTKIELHNMKNHLSYLRRVNAKLVRHFEDYSIKVDDIKDKIEQFESIQYDF